MHDATDTLRVNDPDPDEHPHAVTAAADRVSAIPREPRRSFIPIRRYDPIGLDTSPPPLLWLHGGGFFSGGLRQAEAHRVALGLAKRGWPVITIDYRLVPRPGTAWARRAVHAPVPRYPEPVNEVIASALGLAAEQGGPGIFLGGASAGACLAAAASLRLARAGSSPVLGTVLGYGIFHARAPEAPPALRASVPRRFRVLHGPGALRLMNRNYAGSEAALAEPWAFPGGHALTGFPDTLMLDAERDLIRPSGDAFAAELRADGVRLDREVVPNALHGFLDRPQRPEFQAALDRVAAWLRGAMAARLSLAALPRSGILPAGTPRAIAVGS